MKLPQVKYRQVQSMGRGNLAAVGSQIAATHQQGQAIQRAMDGIAGVTADYIKRKEDAEYNNQISEHHVDMSEWQARNNAKQSYRADEIKAIDEDTVPRTITYTDDAGQTVTETRDSIPAYEVYPHLLRMKLEGSIKDRASKISNPNLRQAFIEKANMDAASMVMRATVAAEQQQQAYELEVGMEKARGAADMGNLAMAQFVVENLETTDLAKKELAEEMEARVESYEITQAIRSSDPETVALMRSLLDDPQYSGSLTEAKRQQAITDLTQRLKFLGAEAKGEMVKAHEAFISDAYFGIEHGAFTLQDVEAGYQRWLDNETDPLGISGKERTQLRNAINRRNAARQTQQDLSALGAELIATGGNPKNRNHQKQIDAYVEQNQVTDLRELEWITFRSNIMPQVLQDFLNIAAIHDAEKGGDQIQAATELFGRLSDSKPEVLAELGKESKDILADTHILTRAGKDPVEAYEFSRELARTKPELRDQRDRDYREQKFLKDNKSHLDQFMDDDKTLYGFETTFWNQSKIPPNQTMESQFNELTYMYYLDKGDVAMARNRAWMDLAEKWSPTEIGATLTVDGIEHGIRAMEYAPERVMMVTPEVAQQRLDAFARANGLASTDNLMVVSDDRTARDGSWQIWVVDTDTNLPNLFTERWVGSEWADEAAQYSYDQAVEEAKKQREEQTSEAETIKLMQIEAEKARSNPFWLSETLQEGGS